MPKAYFLKNITNNQSKGARVPRAAYLIPGRGGLWGGRCRDVRRFRRFHRRFCFRRRFRRSPRMGRRGGVRDPPATHPGPHGSHGSHKSHHIICRTAASPPPRLARELGLNIDRISMPKSIKIQWTIDHKLTNKCSATPPKKGKRRACVEKWMPKLMKNLSTLCEKTTNTWSIIDRQIVKNQSQIDQTINQTSINNQTKIERSWGFM